MDLLSLLYCRSVEEVDESPYFLFLVRRFGVQVVDLVGKMVEAE